jgi:hypothetical protein
MRQPKFISPCVKTYEIDKSDKKSIWVKETPKIGRNIRGTGSNNANPSPHPTPIPIPSLDDFLLQEDGFFILQENDDKIIL